MAETMEERGTTFFSMPMAGVRVATEVSLR
jgi:hypothetical protein